MSSIVQVNVPSGLHNISMKIVKARECVVISVKLISRSFTFSFQGFGENGSFSSQWFQVKSGRKIGNASLETCSQIFEETRRIQDLIQFIGREQNLKDN